MAMAKKPFYSMDEVCQKLGKTPDAIKSLVRDGELREFRDAGKVFFKAEDIDRLAAATAAPATKEDTGEIVLEPAADLDSIDTSEGSGGLPTLTESSGGTSIIGLEPLADEEEKEGTALITSKGVGVFGEDEGEADADPMAKTQITTGATAEDQISLEGAGSGSGLLDLAREADDTALGADLLDEIYPGEEETAEAAHEPAAVAAPAEPAPAAEARAAEEAAEEEEAMAEVEGGEVVMPVFAAAADPYEGLFTGVLAGGFLVLAVAATVVAGVIQGYLPDYGRFLSNGTNFFFFLGGAVVVVAIGLLAGWFIGKAFQPRRR